MPRKNQYFGGIIGADPLPSGSPLTSGVFSLGALSADNAFEAPSLDLSFDGQLSSFTRATTSPTAPKANGDQLATDIVSCTRSTTATFLGSNGLIQTAAVNTPRVEYDASGNPLGLLVEEERTNLWPYSEPLTLATNYPTGWSNTAGEWAAFDANDTMTFVTAPDGTNTAVRYQSGSSNTKLIRLNGGSSNTYSIAAGDTQTVSVWVRNRLSGSTYFSLEAYMDKASFGTVQFSNLPLNDWTRVELTYTNNTGSAISEYSFDVHPQANAAHDFELWGLQLEAGEGATSYIPTSGASATRAADDISVATSAFGFNTANGTALVDATLASKPSATYPGIFDLSASATKRNLFAYLDASLAQVSSQFSEANATNNLVASGVTYPLDITVAQRRDNTTGGGAVDGTLLSGVTIDTAITAPTTLYLGRNVNDRINGHIRRFTYWPRAINDASLVAYTGDNPPTIDIDKPTRRWGGITGRSLVESTTRYEINHSLLFNATGEFLASPTMSASNRQTFTLSAWIKPSSLPALYLPVFAGMYVVSGDNQQMHLGLEGGELSYFEFNNSFITYLNTNTTPISAGTWHHVVFAIDTTAQSPGDRVKIWLNGSQQSLALQNSTSYYPANYQTLMSAGTWDGTSVAQQLTVGAGHSFSNPNTYRAFPGQLAEMHFIDGQALDPTDFGETVGGTWYPKAYSGTYGTNGFYLDFANNSTASALGTDSSGNSNNFSVTNIGTSDQSTDVPTANPTAAALPTTGVLTLAEHYQTKL